MPSIETGFLDHNGAHLFYEVAGAGRPVLLLHAGIADSRMWDDQFVALADECRVARTDLRGFGRSTSPPAAFSFSDDLAALMRHLDMPSAVVVGASFGGRVAIDMALAYPALVDGLVLIGSALGGYRMSSALDAAEEEIVAAFEAGDLARAAEVDLRAWVDGPQRTPEQVDPAVRERARLMAEGVYAAAVDGLQPQAPAPPASERLRELRVPTLVLVGDLDQPDMLRIADRLAAGIPNARKTIIHDTAHLPNLERPEEINRLLLDFLRELPEPARHGVHLREIGPDNWQAVVDLRLRDDQRDLVDSNAVSLAESRYHPWMLPLAVYRDDEPVGFVMFSQWPDPREPRYWVHRFMIDERNQNQGLGRAAMHAVIARMRALPGCDEIWIGYVPRNDLARRFYASLGFVEHGEAPWGGDIIARLAPAPAQ